MRNKKILFCLTFAGGTATFYERLIQRIQPDVEVICFDYSGHGKRYKEKLPSDFEEVANDFYLEIYTKYREIIEEENTIYALMGYSMGSIAVVEVLKKIIEENNLKKPAHIFIAAHAPKTNDFMMNLDKKELEEAVKKRTIDFGGVPDELVGNKSFWRMYTPIYQADYMMISKYKFEKLSLKSEIPTTVFYSDSDTKRDEIILWSDYFVGEIEYLEYEGNHFFYNEHYTEMAEVIKKRMECNDNVIQ